MNEIIDTYNESNGSVYFAMGSSYYYFDVGQSFQNLNKEMLLNSCKFYLNKVGSPTGNAVARIFNLSGTSGTSGIPDGYTPLETSDSLDVSIISGAGLQEFTFNGDLLLHPNGYYAIDLNYENGGIDNYILFGLDNTSPTHDGNLFGAAGGSGWVPQSDNDAIFYVYGTELDWGGAEIDGKYPLPALVIWYN